ncbi:hypothetical protein Sjap_008524 [Stephania japonica]|uniref:Uncharacterized protein n=1 Tax=Stephania japonica TaxID=461633 RepID=A0AAP0JQI0_9MAGN
MADPVTYGNPERDIEHAIIILKKGTQLLKFSRKGKPKLRQFRLSPDETTLIWYSHGEQRQLNLSTVSKIIAGQRTAVFRRHPRPEKDYFSFSLLYNNCERSLDLICKDKVETEIWFTGLKALICSGQRYRRTKSDIPDFYDGLDYNQNSRPSNVSLENTSSIARSDAGSDRSNMQGRSSNVDGFRISISSAPSSTSQGSGPDDIESLGDVYVWGEVWSDGILADGSPLSSVPSKVDVLLPKPLESNVVLDVEEIACGVRHAALVTRQGEVFTWGEESGGRLGHGIDKDSSRPQLVEFLAVNNVDCVACGEFHTCAVTKSGDLFTWGDGNHNAGLLGHGSDISHWIPKRVCGPLEGIPVLSVACGTWHSALITSNGRLFTFGDGSFGVLGHDNRESVAMPKEVKSLMGLRVIQVACGLWHSAAIVEVMNKQPEVKSNSGKLFTWGDGDKNRLGQGDKQPRLEPTCVPTLIDYSFQKVTCGHNITVALTNSGYVFTMGSPAYGQLGNPLSDGKVPCLVQDKLVGETVEEISCGSAHVAVLTSRSEVYTWGRGANGRLGHGDIEDRKAPTLIEALRDRHVKKISCGSNFTSSICIHKWVSGVDQSVCSGCRQTFGFGFKKRHNCYNCGLVFCNSCSSKKALRAALAPTPGKPHRVCDGCYVKLKAAEAGSSRTFNTNTTAPRRSVDSRDRFDRGDTRASRPLLPSSSAEVVKHGSLTPAQYSLKPVVTTAPQSLMNRPGSPFSRKPNSPRSTTPVFSKSIIDSLKKTNELLNNEVQKLQSQVKRLKQKTEVQDAELQRLQNSAQQSASLAAEGSLPQSMITRDTIVSLAAKMKELAENLPPEMSNSENFKEMQNQVEALLRASNVKQSVDYTESSHRYMLDESVLSANGSSASTTQDHSTANHSDATDSPRAAEENRASTDLSSENASKSPQNSVVRNEGRESTEQFEPGVYITFYQLPNGNRVFRRVRFSKKRYNNQQAADWWVENQQRVYRRYRPNAMEIGPTTSSVSNSSTEETDG